jgi:transposase
LSVQAVTAAMVPDVNVSALARRLGISPPQQFGWRKAHLKTLDAATSAHPSPQALTEIMIGDADRCRIIRAVRTA